MPGAYRIKGVKPNRRIEIAGKQSVQGTGTKCKIINSIRAGGQRSSAHRSIAVTRSYLPASCAGTDNHVLVSGCQIGESSISGTEIAISRHRFVAAISLEPVIPG